MLLHFLENIIKKKKLETKNQNTFIFVKMKNTGHTFINTKVYNEEGEQHAEIQINQHFECQQSKIVQCPVLNSILLEQFWILEALRAWFHNTQLGLTSS